MSILLLGTPLIGAIPEPGLGADSPTARPTQLRTAEASYRRYVIGQADGLAKAAAAFNGTVGRGNLDVARAEYSGVRRFYERIEAVAATFGALDANLDAHYGDVPEAKWRGFHRIERDLFERRLINVMTKRRAREFAADSRALAGRVRTLAYPPTANLQGATELLNEISSAKVTGEEERYSHTDMNTIAANLEGARAAFTTSAPALKATNSPLVATIAARFAALNALLPRHRRGSGWVTYTAVTPAQRRELSQAVDALAEPLSKAAAALAVA